VHVYSDVPALAIKQAGHSKDFTRRQYPGTYSLVSIVPLLDLWPQAIATGDVLAYAERHRDTDLEREEYRILYPAYGASLGGVVGDAVAGVAFLPIYAGSVVAWWLDTSSVAGRPVGSRAAGRGSRTAATSRSRRFSRTTSSGCRQPPTRPRPTSRRSGWRRLTATRPCSSARPTGLGSRRVAATAPRTG